MTSPNAIDPSGNGLAFALLDSLVLDWGEIFLMEKPKADMISPDSGSKLDRNSDEPECN